MVGLAYALGAFASPLRSIQVVSKKDGRFIKSAPPNHSNTGADTGRADFTSRTTALDWGFDISETIAKLMEVSAKAKENVRVMQN